MNKELQFLIYNTPQENVKIDVVVKDETIWLTQKAMATLFDVQQPAIAKHLQNIFASGELAEHSVYSILEYTAADGKNYATKFYNLDAVISVGYRVNSAKATQFRIWATKMLKEFITKGFVLDDERLKQGKTAFGKDYFRELLERVRSIRASERRIWQQITDILPSAALIMIETQKLPAISLQWCKTSFITPLQGKRQPKLFTPKPTATPKIWV
jgi:hypothetical protein